MFLNVIPTGKWTIDPTHSSINFQVKHLMVSKVKGQFGTFDGEAIVNEDNIELKSTIDMTTITTNQADRDTHLRSADFFDVDNFPQATFVSTSFEPVNDEHGNLTGDLTIHGVTKPVTFAIELGGVAKDPYGQTKAAIEGTAKISRGDFGLTWNSTLETGGVLVSDEVTLTLDIQAVLSE